MNKKYERYIDYIINDIKPPYIYNMREIYGLSEDEYKTVLSKVFNTNHLGSGKSLIDKRLVVSIGYCFIIIA